MSIYKTLRSIAKEKLPSKNFDYRFIKEQSSLNASENDNIKHRLQLVADSVTATRAKDNIHVKIKNIENIKISGYYKAIQNVSCTPPILCIDLTDENSSTDEITITPFENRTARHIIVILLHKNGATRTTRGTKVMVKETGGNPILDCVINILGLKPSFFLLFIILLLVYFLLFF